MSSISENLIIDRSYRRHLEDESIGNVSYHIVSKRSTTPQGDEMVVDADKLSELLIYIGEVLGDHDQKLKNIEESKRLENQGGSGGGGRG